jgi:hypothetical protein
MAADELKRCKSPGNDKIPVEIILSGDKNTF